MTINAFRQFRNKVNASAHNSFLYNLSLNNWNLGGVVPDQLLVKPVDPWPGNAENGAHILDGCFSIGQEQLRIQAGGWHPINIGQKWLFKLHGFQWMRDLRALGGSEARQIAKAYIHDWIINHRNYDAESWQPHITGSRLAAWICHYDFFDDPHDEDFQDTFFVSLIKQTRHLTKCLPGTLEGLEALYALKGLLYAGLALPHHENLVHKALDLLKDQTKIQILSDGGHVTRNPDDLLQALVTLLDIRTALTAAGYPTPDFLQYTIDRAGPALRFFVYGDKYMAVTNGSGESDPEFIDSVLAQAGVRGKIISNLPTMGYERITQGRSLILFDTGKTAKWPHDKNIHAAPLSFEMSYGKERLLVSCGTHVLSDEWNASLRATAAHNTLCIDHRNACEIRADGHLGRKVIQPFIKREEDRKACLIEASHDGYLSLNGITHSRRLFLCEQGSDLRGEDTLECVSAPTDPINIAVRFHIHPRVLVSLVQNETEALLRLPSGIGWRFHHTGGTLSLENSVYLGNGEIRKTKQLVIHGQMSCEHAQVKWAFQREGL